MGDVDNAMTGAHVSVTNPIYFSRIIWIVPLTNCDMHMAFEPVSLAVDITIINRAGAIDSDGGIGSAARLRRCRKRRAIGISDGFLNHKFSPRICAGKNVDGASLFTAAGFVGQPGRSVRGHPHMAVKAAASLRIGCARTGRYHGRPIGRS